MKARDCASSLKSRSANASPGGGCQAQSWELQSTTRIPASMSGLKVSSAAGLASVGRRRQERRARPSRLRLWCVASIHAANLPSGCLCWRASPRPRRRHFVLRQSPGYDVEINVIHYLFIAPPPRRCVYQRFEFPTGTEARSAPLYYRPDTVFVAEPSAISGIYTIGSCCGVGSSRRSRREIGRVNGLTVVSNHGGSRPLTSSSSYVTGAPKWATIWNDAVLS